MTADVWRPGRMISLWLGTASKAVLKISGNLQAMEISQSFEIEGTPVQKFSIATTAVSEAELSLIDLPSHITLSPTLTPRTRMLLTYKAVFTGKHVQALKWNIPVVSVNYLYDLGSSYKKYELKPFQGALFSTSGISEEIYSNYFVLLGAKYEPNCTIFIDFLVCDGVDSEKYRFCVKYGIPVVKTSDVFKGDYSIFVKRTKYDAKQIMPKAMFFEKVFYLDPGLPKKLFNRLKRLIIENEGTRVSNLSGGVDYVLTQSLDQFRDHQSKVVHYQYVFDCQSCNSLLFPEFYRVNLTPPKTVLPEVIAVVDKKLENAGKYVNKLRSMGCVVKGSLDMRVTHYFSRDVDQNTIRQFSRPASVSSLGTACRDQERLLPFRVLDPDWIDQCLCTMGRIKEGRFLSNQPILNLKRRLSSKKSEEMVFQFTGLPEYFKDEAIRKFREYNIKFIDSDRFEGCTHLIMGSINSSEKLFSSLVGGCWILRPDFVQDFENQPNFDFEKYEWVPTAEMSQKDRRIAGSIRKWRVQIQEGRKKPFQRWNVKIYCSDGKKENYMRLIESGGGSMDDSRSYTHVFFDRGCQSSVEEKNATSIGSIFGYLLR